MSIKNNDVRVSPQAIRNRESKVAAFELLHRQGDAVSAQISDDLLATEEIIHLVYDNSAHGQKILQGLPGFINVDAEMLFSSRIESLPTEQVVLELLETVEVDERVINRCADLKRRGFQLALDDVCECRTEHTPLFELADIVKVDLPSLDTGDLETLVGKLRQFPLLLLAEKVDSRQCAKRCVDLKFDLFQGYYFDPPPSPASVSN